MGRPSPSFRLERIVTSGVADEAQSLLTVRSSGPNSAQNAASSASLSTWRRNTRTPYCAYKVRSSAIVASSSRSHNRRPTTYRVRVGWSCRASSIVVPSVIGKVGEEIKSAHYPGAEPDPATRTAPTTLAAFDDRVEGTPIRMMRRKLPVHLTLAPRNPQTTT